MPSNAIVNHEAASSALYHIEGIERRLKLMKQYINPQSGTVCNTEIVSKLVIGVDDELVGLRNVIVRFL